MFKCICGKEFSEKKGFASHKKSCALYSKRVICDCGKTFDNENSFNKHKYYCDKYCETHNITKKTREVKDNEVVCPNCGRKLMNNVSLANHLRVCRNKGIDDITIIDPSLTIKQLKKLNGVSEEKMKQRCIRINPMLLFSYGDEFYLKEKKSIIRHYISFSNEELFFESVNKFVEKYDNSWCGVAKSRFLTLLLTNHKAILIKLINKYTTWELAEKLCASQAGVRRICKLNNVEIPHRNSSKLHLALKELIQELLGETTITEHYINSHGHKYYIDEYCPALKLCIEIDGIWCHSEERDATKDKHLIEDGYKMARVKISNKYDEDSLKTIVKSSLEEFIRKDNVDDIKIELDYLVDSEETPDKNVISDKPKTIKRKTLANKTRAYKSKTPCPECNGKNGHHYKTCSKYKPHNTKECPECHAKGSHYGWCSKSSHLTCPECGGKNGCHRNGCSKKKQIICPECGAKQNNHKPSCSKYKICPECGGVRNHHRKNCSKYHYEIKAS